MQHEKTAGDERATFKIAIPSKQPKLAPRHATDTLASNSSRAFSQTLLVFCDVRIKNFKLEIDMISQRRAKDQRSKRYYTCHVSKENVNYLPTPYAYFFGNAHPHSIYM